MTRITRLAQRKKAEWVAWMERRALFVFIGAITLITIGCIAGLALTEEYTTPTEKDVKAAQEAWDARVDRPNSITLLPGQQAAPPALGVNVHPGWASCIAKGWVSGKALRRFHRGCTDLTALPLSAYPYVIPIGEIELAYGCATVKWGWRATAVMAGATRANAYSATLHENGTALTMCATTDQQPNDKIAIWSNDLAPASPRTHN